MLYGACMAALIFLLKWLEWKYLIMDHPMEIYIGSIALIFTILGIWIASKLSARRVETVIVEKEIIIHQPEAFTPNDAELKKLNLTSREWDVLQHMSQGKSNNEIAESLFLSVSTIKTHASNIFVKMDVKSRAQAIEKAKRLRITP